MDRSSEAEWNCDSDADRDWPIEETRRNHNLFIDRRRSREEIVVLVDRGWAVKIVSINRGWWRGINLVHETEIWRVYWLCIGREAEVIKENFIDAIVGRGISEGKIQEASQWWNAEDRVLMFVRRFVLVGYENEKRCSNKETECKRFINSCPYCSNQTRLRMRIKTRMHVHWIQQRKKIANRLEFCSEDILPRLGIRADK